MIETILKHGINIKRYNTNKTLNEKMNKLDDIR